MTQLSGLMFGLLALLIVESPAAQTNYPEKPIRIVVGFPPGGQADTVARLLGQKLPSLGKPIVVDNAPGAAGAIAADRVAKAAPDGYTLGLLSQAQIVVNPSLYKLAYDPVKDFAPVSQVTASMYYAGCPQRRAGEERQGVGCLGQSAAWRAHVRLRRQR